jgi:chromosome segregation ATPase
MEKLPTTIEELAAMIYKHMDEQMDGLRGEMSDLSDLKDTMKDMVEELTATHEDVRYLRRSVDMLVRNDAAQDAAINTLATRVQRLEKKVGLAN